MTGGPFQSSWHATAGAAGGMVVVASHGAAFVENAQTLDLGEFSAAHIAHWSDEL